MRVLHTADWHLGQRFHTQQRVEEQAMALDWLLDTIRNSEIDLLLVAGDIFDTGNPPNQAKKQYYRFLHALMDTSCAHVVITGGNHDSPSMLDAPQALLRQLDIHVLGSVPEDPAQQILPLYRTDGSLQAVVAAVPFLRDRDLRSAMPGLHYADQTDDIQQAIKAHYERLAELVGPYRDAGVPILTTGHLYARGATASELQANIYLGDRENLSAADFPDVFDYVALGHLHRAQPVNNMRHIRYSGSLIPLSFSEIEDSKSVTLIDFSNFPAQPDISLLPVPTFRKLRTVAGTLEEVTQSLKDLAKDHESELHDWIDVVVTPEKVTSDLQSTLYGLTADLPLELLKIRLNYREMPLADIEAPEVQLDELTPLEVFEKKCTSVERDPADVEALKMTFLELLQWMEAQHEEARNTTNTPA